jgi:thioredoxin 1
MIGMSVQLSDVPIRTNRFEQTDSDEPILQAHTSPYKPIQQPYTEVTNMAELEHLDESNFDDTVEQHDLPLLVDFYAEWCPPCRRLGPVLEDLAGELDGRLTIMKVDVQSSQSLASRLGVMNIPTMILYKDGEEIDRLVGGKAKKALLKELEPHLA